MGPCGPLPSCLHRAVAATPGRADRRACRPVDRRSPGRPAPAPRPPAPACRRRRAPPPAGLLRPGPGTLVVLRFQLPHHALAVLYGVDRATITRAVHEIRPLLATRGFAIPRMPGVRLRTLADVVAYAQAEGVELRVDGPETQVRRPRADRWGRRAFVSGKKRQNTLKVTTVCDRQGRTLWAGAVRPGRMHDQTAIKTEGIEDLLRRHHDVHAKVDAGYQGLAKAFSGRVHAPPPKPAKAAAPEELAAWQRART